MLIWGPFPFPSLLWACHRCNMNDDGAGSGPYCAGTKGMNRAAAPLTRDAPQGRGLPGAEWVLMGLLCPPTPHPGVASYCQTARFSRALRPPPLQEDCVLGTQGGGVGNLQGRAKKKRNGLFEMAKT